MEIIHFIIKQSNFYYIVEVILLNNKGSFIKWTFLSIFLETHQNTVILRYLGGVI